MQPQQTISLNHETLYIGWDPGHSDSKTARVCGQEIITYTLPATVGLANRGRKDGLTLTGLVRQAASRARQPFHVAFDEMEYLAGPNVDQYTTPINRMDYELDRFTDSPELRATFYASIYRIINGGPHRLALAIALPVALLEDANKATLVEQGMQKWLLGEHHFTVDGMETALTITDVRVKIPQPVATWYDWGLDMSGQWIKGKEALRAPTLIIDEGFNTLDVLVVESARISDRLSGGDDLGMSRAAEELIETVKHRYDGLTLELCRANELVKQAINGQKVEIYVHGERTDITQLTKSCVKSLEAQVGSYLDRSLKKIKAGYHVLLTGGGVLAMPQLSQRFPGATVMYEPVLANARGLAKMAVKPGFLKD